MQKLEFRALAELMLALLKSKQFEELERILEGIIRDSK